MQDLAFSMLISIIMVVVDFVGQVFSKWTIAKSRGQQRGDAAVVKRIMSMGTHAMADMEEIVRAARKEALKKELTKVFTDILPGPEIVFLSLTIVVAIFVSFEQATAAQRQALSPLLTKVEHPSLALLFCTLLLIALWVCILIWREAIVTETQRKWIKRSIAIIVLLSGLSLTLSLYILVAQRTVVETGVGG